MFSGVSCSGFGRCFGSSLMGLWCFVVDVLTCLCFLGWLLLVVGA